MFPLGEEFRIVTVVFDLRLEEHADELDVEVDKIEDVEVEKGADVGSEEHDDDPVSFGPASSMSCTVSSASGTSFRRTATGCSFFHSL